MITYGAHLQDQQNTTLDNILGKVDKADEIAISLYGQIEKLQNIENQAKSIQSIQKKNERSLKYFEKNL